MEVKGIHVLGVLVIISLLLVLFSYTPAEEGPRVVGDPNALASFLDANTVVIRTVYPFSDAQGAVGAVSYLSIVLSAKGKTVILQSFKDNVCYTNEGNVEVVVEKNIDECILPYPTIVIREGENLITLGPSSIVISGSPPNLMEEASFILKKIYPDADRVYREALSILNRRRS